MFLLSTIKLRGDLHSTGITQLLRYSGPHRQNRSLLPRFPFYRSLGHTRRGSDPRQEATVPPGLQSSVLVVYSTPSTTPERARPLALVAIGPVACGQSHTLGLSQPLFSGLIGFSVLHFTS